MAEKDEEKGYSVKDRRAFSPDGETREEAAPKASGEERKEEAPGRREAPEGGGKPKEGGKRKGGEESSWPEMNFSGFVLSLHTSALFHFGDFQDPKSGEKKVDLEAAKQTIDILSMLKEKTRGNLTENEQRLVDGALFELRMRYVKEMGIR
jgi:hypothetical protein